MLQTWVLLDSRDIETNTSSGVQLFTAHKKVCQQQGIQDSHQAGCSMPAIRGL